MFEQNTPRWLQLLERPFNWLAIPHIAILIVTLQAAGFLFVSLDPVWIDRLALVPAAVLQGEYWRLITFLALPLSLSPIWVIFVLWFLYFIVDSIEQQWGAFKATFYVLVSWLMTIGFSFAFRYPVVNITHFESTLFLAAAALFPEMEVRLFFAIPVKMKWLAGLTLAFFAYELLTSEWIDRLFLLAIYSNYILFFGPALLKQFRLAYRRWQFRRRQ